MNNWGIRLTLYFLTAGLFFSFFFRSDHVMEVFTFMLVEKAQSDMKLTGQRSPSLTSVCYSTIKISKSKSFFFLEG